MNISMSKEDSLYFIQSLIPKNHTQALDFIKENPNYNGRNVRIAIWDTGIDPASEGLQITPEGKPKLIHMRDTSGSGDVPLLNTVRPDSLRRVKLLSNREITIPDSWPIGDDQLRVGIKSAADLFPVQLVSRLSREYKEQVWNIEMCRLQSDIADKKKPKTSTTNIADSESTLLKECLDMMEKSYEYPMPLFDCIVFHSDEGWLTCVDTTPLNPDLKLEDIPLLYSFDVKRQFSNFGGKTNLNFAVNIHEDGKLLEIVSCCGSHGTHVASIAAGYFPSKPECNGIAPGAEVVNIKIADTRLASMETGMALAFAAKVTVDLKCDIVNLSFGESSMQPNCGRICQIMQELVSKHGIVFCSSSGNDGPALSTVGSPGGTTDTIFGISPLVFPDMVESNYSLPIDRFSELSPQVYTWASRGPTTDGSLGIHVAAPGAAITSVATWQNRSVGLMNGSSMSSPNACGGLSLLICAARHLKKPITPWLIALCTANTAAQMPNISRLSQGYGLLQVKSSFSLLERYWAILENQLNEKRGDYLLKEKSIFMKEDLDLTNEMNSNEFLKSSKTLSLPAITTVGCSASLYSQTIQTPIHLFRIKCNLSNGHRGIFLREPYETAQKRNFTVNISPDFNEETMKIFEQVNIQMHLNLVCSASWVNCPRFFSFFNQERSISIQVDPTLLHRNLPEFEIADNNDHSDYGIYFTEIEFYCLEYAQLGPLARLPIIVFKPEPVTSLQWFQKTKFSAKRKTVRHFLATPPGATSLMITIKTISIVEGSGRFELRIMQVLPSFSTVTSELSKSFSFDKKMNMTINESVAYILVGSTSSNVEIALAQYWSAMNEAELEYSVEFHGLTISTDIVKMLSSENHYRLLIESQLQLEEICPSISLNYFVIPIRPFKDEITYLHKSISTDKELINLELFYTFNNPKPGNVGIFCPALGNLLYENDFYCQLYQIFDSNGRIVGTGDYKPEMALRHRNKYFFWLEKGDFKVQLNIRHGSMVQLERLKDQAIHVYFKTFQSLTFEFSKTIVDVNHNKKISGPKLNCCVAKGEKLVLYITTNMSKNLKSYPVGSYLYGTLSLYKNDTLRRAVSYPFQYIFTAHQSQQEKIENIQNLKLPVTFTESLMGYLKNEETGRNSPIQVVSQKDDELVSSTECSELSVKSTEICKKDFQNQMELLIKKPQFKDGILKYLISWVKEFHNISDQDCIENLIQQIHGDKCNTELQLAQLRLLMKNNSSLNLKPDERWMKVESISSNLTKLWDTKELADYLSAKYSDATIHLSKEQKSKFDETKQHLTEVLCIYGLSLCEMIVETEKDYSEVDKDSSNDIHDKLNTVYYQVCRFVSPWDNNSICLPFFLIHSYVFKCHGRMLKLLLKSYEEQSAFNVIFLIREVLLKLEWHVLARHYELLIAVRHPTACQQMKR